MKLIKVHVLNHDKTSPSYQFAVVAINYPSDGSELKTRNTTSPIDFYDDN